MQLEVQGEPKEYFLFMITPWVIISNCIYNISDIHPQGCMDTLVFPSVLWFCVVGHDARTVILSPRRSCNTTLHLTRYYERKVYNACTNIISISTVFLNRASTQNKSHEQHATRGYMFCLDPGKKTIASLKKQ